MGVPTPGAGCTSNPQCGAGGTFTVGSCGGFVANASTPGQLCYKSDGFAPQQPFNQGCLAVGNAKRLLDQAMPGNVCP